MAVIVQPAHQAEIFRVRDVQRVETRFDGIEEFRAGCIQKISEERRARDDAPIRFVLGIENT